jgi:hypothetical protein
MADTILLKAKTRIECPFLMVVDDPIPYLWCPNGHFYKKDIISHFLGWALEPCLECSLSGPAMDSPLSIIITKPIN